MSKFNLEIFVMLEPYALRGARTDLRGGSRVIEPLTRFMESLTIYGLVVALALLFANPFAS